MLVAQPDLCKVDVEFYAFNRSKFLQTRNIYVFQTSNQRQK